MFAPSHEPLIHIILRMPGSARLSVLNFAGSTLKQTDLTSFWLITPRFGTRQNTPNFEHYSLTSHLEKIIFFWSRWGEECKTPS